MDLRNNSSCLFKLTAPLHFKCAPDKVKYRVFHRLKILHFPFFSFSCPSITGCCVLLSRNSAFSGLLHLKLMSIISCKIDEIKSNSQKTSPAIIQLINAAVWWTQIENIKKSRMSQLNSHHFLISNRWKSARHQCYECSIVKLQYIPAMFQTCYAAVKTA